MMAKMAEDSWLDDLVCSVLFKPMCSLLDLGIKRSENCPLSIQKFLMCKILVTTFVSHHKMSLRMF